MSFASVILQWSLLMTQRSPSDNARNVCHAVIDRVNRSGFSLAVLLSAGLEPLQFHS